MSKLRGPSPTHDPVKPFKLFAVQTTDSLSRTLKVAFVILFLASISLVIYAAFTRRAPFFPCPDCDDPIREFQSLCNEALNDTIAESPVPANIPFENLEGPPPTDLSHIVFGIGGSVDTWHERRWYSESWWRRNVTRGYVWLDRAPDPVSEWPENSPPYRVSEDWSRFKFKASDSAIRMARIVLETYRLGLPDVRWFVMGDDDTVFFTENLVSVLTRYDHREMYYIGGNSESVEQDVIHAFGMAFGGGGIALSYPLAAELVRILDGCLDRYYEFYGSDQRIWACVSELGVSLTRERGFHQIDLRGDLYGLLAAHPVAPLVSLHHLDGVTPLYPGRTQLESLQALMRAYRVDPAQALQQSFCYDFNQNWSVSISWGYSAQIYNHFVTALDLATPLRTFKTWRSWADGPFSFNTRPMSSKPCERPLVYYLEKVKEVAEGWTLSTYSMNVVEKQRTCYADVMQVRRIAVLAPKMDPREWNMAPRRRCCEITEGLKKKKKSMVVKIRKCKLGESVSF